MMDVVIIDYWGKERPFDPSRYANEESRFLVPAEEENLFLAGSEKKNLYDLRKLLSEEFGRKTLESIHDWWLNRSNEERYMFSRMEAEIELYLGWRLNNGYHLHAATVDNIAKALQKGEEAQGVTTEYRAIIQAQELDNLVFRNDQAAFLEKLYPSNLVKHILYAYCIAVKSQPPGIALEAAKSDSAASQLKRYGVDDKGWTQTLDERIVQERKKKRLD